MRQTHLDPNDMSRMTTTTRAVETPRPMSDTQKKVVAGAVLFGVPAASLFGFGSMGLGLWIFWYLFFYSFSFDKNYFLVQTFTNKLSISFIIQGTFSTDYFFGNIL